MKIMEINMKKIRRRFLISNFRRALYVACFLLGNSPASEFYMSTFRSTLFHLLRQLGTPTWLWRWIRQSVPKRRHLKFRRWRITQKKTYNKNGVDSEECVWFWDESGNDLGNGNADAKNYRENMKAKENYSYDETRNWRRRWWWLSGIMIIKSVRSVCEIRRKIIK